MLRQSASYNFGVFRTSVKFHRVETSFQNPKDLRMLESHNIRSAAEPPSPPRLSRDLCRNSTLSKPREVLSQGLRIGAYTGLSKSCEGSFACNFREHNSDDFRLLGISRCLPATLSKGARHNWQDRLLITLEAAEPAFCKPDKHTLRTKKALWSSGYLPLFQSRSTSPMEQIIEYQPTWSSHGLI